MKFMDFEKKENSKKRAGNYFLLRGSNFYKFLHHK